MNTLEQFVQGTAVLAIGYLLLLIAKHIGDV